MSRFWTTLVHSTKPYVPGEQPRLLDLVKLNTNENPFGPSPRTLDAVRAEARESAMPVGAFGLAEMIAPPGRR
jgi:histidinol-phosphate aminotransferase